MYNRPEKIQNKIHLKNAQFYVSGQNLFLLYNANKILDPEVGGLVTSNAGAAPDQNIYTSSGSVNYPIMKVFTIGARITL